MSQVLYAGYAAKCVSLLLVTDGLFTAVFEREPQVLQGELVIRSVPVSGVADDYGRMGSGHPRETRARGMIPIYSFKMHSGKLMPAIYSYS